MRYDLLASPRQMRALPVGAERDSRHRGMVPVVRFKVPRRMPAARAIAAAQQWAVQCVRFT